MKGYLGPDYDDSGLEKARELARKTMDSFPVQQAKRRGPLSHARPDQRRPGGEDLQDRYVLQASRQGDIGRVLSSARFPALAQHPSGPSKPSTSWRSSPRCRATPSKPSKIMIPPGSILSVRRRHGRRHGRNGRHDGRHAGMGMGMADGRHGHDVTRFRSASRPPIPADGLRPQIPAAG